MTPPTRDDANDYLWDRSGPVDPVVADLERALAPLAYQPSRHPLTLPARSRRRWPVLAAVAATLFVASAVWLFYWRLEWPAGRPWRMELSTQGGAGQTGLLAVGQTLTLDGASTASIDVARLGTMDVQSASDLTLTQTTSDKHRLRLDRGVVRVRVWAPPSRVVVSTPAGEVIDLGCVFTLAVDGFAAYLTVETGWVQLENSHGEVLVPAGASSEMSADRQPLVPVYEDATDVFRRAVRGLESSALDATPALRDIRRDSRARDVPTLLVLALRMPDSRRAALLQHAATLAPPRDLPPAGAGSLDDAAVWNWFDSLPLPPAKSWWRNWPDAFRR
jgi:hypothetical protein